MSAMVTQLSFNINEKLRLDETPFTSYNKVSKNDDSNSVTKASTSLDKEKRSQWLPTPTSSSFTPLISSSSENNQQQNLKIPSCASSSHKAALQNKTFSTSHLTTFTDAKHDHLFENKYKLEKSLKFVQMDQEKQYNESTNLFTLHKPKNLSSLDKISSFSNNNESLHKQLHQNDCSHNSSPFKQPLLVSPLFPPTKGRNYKFRSQIKPYSPIKENSNPAACHHFPTGIPATKRHCRSVSEPEEFGMHTKLAVSKNINVEYSKNPSLLWNPNEKSKLWRPVARVGSRKNSNCQNTSSFNLMSQSHDCATFAAKKEEFVTPPASPVPRPASVTVIKHESGYWTCLSACSQQVKVSTFSPLSSPSAATSKCETKSLSNSLSATKRSLSFSDDFEHRESVHYTPSTCMLINESNTSQQGNLLRCKSHPADLNVKKLRNRRRAGSLYNHRAKAAAYNRPNIDFLKQKKTALNKYFCQPSANAKSNYNASKMIGFESNCGKSSSNNKIRNAMISNNTGRITSFFTPTKGSTLSTMHTRYGGPSELKALKSCGKNNALTIMSSEDLMEEDDLMLDCNELNVDEIENEID